MKLRITIIPPKQKYNSGLHRQNWLQKKKKGKTGFLSGKVMATAFWDSHGAILINYFRKGKIITGAYYTSLLEAESKNCGKQPHLR
jgi:hypothetical protein